jgi:hypothetical protein
MRTFNELVAEVQRLSPQERLALLEVLTRSIQEDHSQPAWQGSTLAWMRGLARPTGPMPTDAELKDDYAEHLGEKHTSGRIADVAGSGQGRVVTQTPSEQPAIAHVKRWQAKAARSR